jgi:predicted permease
MIGPLLDGLRRDLRDAIRSLGRTPTFTITAILILGLGIGMATAMFTVFEQVVVQRLPVQDQDQLIELSGVAAGARDLPLSGDQYKTFSRQQRTLQSVAGFAHWGAAVNAVMDGDRLLSLHHAEVTANFFQVLGTAPYLGRLFVASDETEYGPTHVRGDALVAVISYDTWQRQFGGDPGVIGRRMRMPEVKWNPVIVGVAPPGLDYPRGVQIWTPNPYPGGMELVARLAAGTNLAAARADLIALGRNDQTYMKFVDARAEPLTAMVLGSARAALMTLTIAVGLLLLLGCVNVGNLLLVRAAGRARELAVRRALGATNRDIARKVGTESGVLGLAGGLSGLALSQVLLVVIVRTAPAGLPRLDMIRVAPFPILIAALVSFAAVVLFGLAPSVVAARADAFPEFRSDRRSGTESRGQRRFRRGLVASQMALALVLLAGAGLLARSFAHLSGLDLGYSTAHLASIRVTMPWDRWMARCGGMPPADDTAAVARGAVCRDSLTFQFHDDLTRALHSLPGIEKVSSTSGPQFLGSSVYATKLRAEGQTDVEAAANPWVGFDYVGPEYFDALGLSLLEGRAFTDADRRDAPYVAIVSEGVARYLWPGKDPIGKRVRMPNGVPQLLTVVGVVHDIHLRVHRTASPMIFCPYQQDGMAQGSFLVRTRGVLPSRAAIRSVLHATDASSELVDAASMDDVIAPQLAQPRLNAWLLAVFALAAMGLSAIGLYGTMASVVSQQTREFGVRMALGATAEQVRRMILRQALAIAGIGAACGLAGALAGSRLLSSLLFEVSPTDPVTLVGVSLLLLGVALVAAYLPARRATKIDPAVALRAE